MGIGENLAEEKEEDWNVGEEESDEEDGVERAWEYLKNLGERWEQGESESA